jgi:hypothetical protein
VAFETEGLAVSRLLVAPTVVGDDAVVVHPSRHSGKGTSPVKAPVHANNGRHRGVSSPLPDGEMGNIWQWKGGEAKGGGIGGSYR